jgi:hypothetical protein
MKSYGRWKPSFVPEVSRHGGTHFFWQLLRRLANDLKIQQDSVKDRLVGAESGLRATGHNTFDLLGAFNQITEIQQPATRHGSHPSQHGGGRAA